MPDRRALLGLGALGLGALGLGAALLLAGCAGGPPISSEAGRVHFGAVEVTAGADEGFLLPRAAPILADQLKRQLGARYTPGARGAATLRVRLTDVVLLSTGAILTDRSDYPSGTPFDSLEGTVSIAAAGGRPIASWPLLANTVAVATVIDDPASAPERLPGLARTFAYWVVKKLDQA